MSKAMRRIVPLLITVIILSCIGGGWLWYDNNVDRSGWVEKDGVRFYRDFHADPVSGWLEIGEDRYYFHDDGTPHLGWQDIDGITYYFDDNGAMHTGWLEKDGKLHYFGGNGTMVVGWLWLDEGRYYLRDGALLTGWQEIDGSRYYFSQEGIAALGFAEIDGKQYYFDNGVMTTGPIEVEGQSYLFREDGTMYFGWEELEGGSRYYLPDGTMAVGWQEADGQTRYFDETGLMVTGWYNIGEYRYNFRADGTPCTGKQIIGGETHFFTPKGIEVVLVNGLNPVPQWYQLNPVNVVDYHDVDRLCYDALVKMLADCNAAGIEYTFNSAYRTLNEQTAILEYRTREHMENFKLSFEEARDMAYETVAVPGTSEHHLGLAVDLLGAEAVAWFTEHCWDYGFIVRYTEEKEPITGIVDEPWHFRYVGREVSLDMKDSGLCLEEYLGAEAVSFEKIQALYGDKLYEEVIYGKEDNQK
ncbi:MAG: D-alanyl-D-alanine carboxypeptidase family protein [Oscillospiraceae bacterium]|nr:D-alanyl-D-alanine carboxypeptidase family protein [Oscillospiraceae bacterium]